MLTLVASSGAATPAPSPEYDRVPISVSAVVKDGSGERQKLTVNGPAALVPSFFTLLRIVNVLATGPPGGTNVLAARSGHAAVPPP